MHGDLRGHLLNHLDRYKGDGADDKQMTCDEDACGGVLSVAYPSIGLKEQHLSGLETNSKKPSFRRPQQATSRSSGHAARFAQILDCLP